jgi:hypothetical protein
VELELRRLKPRNSFHRFVGLFAKPLFDPPILADVNKRKRNAVSKSGTKVPGKLGRSRPTNPDQMQDEEDFMLISSFVPALGRRKVLPSPHHAARGFIRRQKWVYHETYYLSSSLQSVVEY